MSMIRDMACMPTLVDLGASHAGKVTPSSQSVAINNFTTMLY